jgi:hypothetical protein
VTRFARLFVSLVALLLACDEGDAHFTTRFASDFSPSRRTVSVLGVYKDGRMSSEGWEALAAHVAPALGGDRCEAGYNAIVSRNESLAGAIDESARAGGPTDELLGQLAPAAKGDLILVLTLAGTLPQRIGPEGGAQPGAAPTPGMGGRSGGRGMRGSNRMGRGTKPESVVDPSVLDISASLYSVAQSRSVAMVAMQYSGTSVDDAMTKFGEKLAQSLRGALCVGWNWDAAIDPDKIRQSIDE